VESGNQEPVSANTGRLYNSRKVKTFPWIIPWKGMSFHGIIRRKACNGELFCVKGGLSLVKSTESSDFFSDYPAERHAFPQKNSQKVKTFFESYSGKACLSAG
jgi:hypothetical protein